MDMQPGRDPRMPDGPRPLIAQLDPPEWGIVIAALRKLPFEVVANIIGKLGDQLTAAQQAAETAAQPPQE